MAIYPKRSGPSKAFKQRWPDLVSVLADLISKSTDAKKTEFLTNLQFEILRRRQKRKAKGAK